MRVAPIQHQVKSLFLKRPKMSREATDLGRGVDVFGEKSKSPLFRIEQQLVLIRSVIGRQQYPTKRRNVLQKSFWISGTECRPYDSMCNLITASSEISRFFEKVVEAARQGIILMVRKINFCGR